MLVPFSLLVSRVPWDYSHWWPRLTDSPEKHELGTSVTPTGKWWWFVENSGTENEANAGADVGRGGGGEGRGLGRSGAVEGGEGSETAEEDTLVIELDRLMSLVLRDFVNEWYKVAISAQDHEFPENVRIIVHDLVRELAPRMRQLDPRHIIRLVERVLVLFREHIRCYKDIKPDPTSRSLALAPASPATTTSRPPEESGVAGSASEKDVAVVGARATSKMGGGGGMVGAGWSMTDVASASQPKGLCVHTSSTTAPDDPALPAASAAWTSERTARQ